MAFIPDNALDRYEELQPKSQIAYSFLCRYRDHKTGCSTKTLRDCAEKYGWSRATYFNVKKELENGWIDKNYFLKVGDFSPVNKSKKLDSEPEKSLKNYTEKSKILDSPPHTPQKEYINTSSKDQQEEAARYTLRLIEFVQEQKNTLAGLNKSWEWERVFSIAFEKQIEAEQVEKCYLLLEKEKLLNQKSYNITAAMISDHILNIAELEAKIYRLENNEHGKQQTGKKGNADILAEYQEYFAGEAFQSLGNH